MGPPGGRNRDARADPGKHPGSAAPCDEGRLRGWFLVQRGGGTELVPGDPVGQALRMAGRALPGKHLRFHGTRGQEHPIRPDGKRKLWPGSGHGAGQVRDPERGDAPVQGEDPGEEPGRCDEGTGRGHPGPRALQGRLAEGRFGLPADGRDLRPEAEARKPAVRLLRGEQPGSGDDGGRTGIGLGGGRGGSTPIPIPARPRRTPQTAGH